MFSKYRSISGIVVNYLANSTNRRIEDDLRKFKEKFLKSHSEVDFNHLFINYNVIPNLSDELKQEFLQLDSIRKESRKNFVLINNNLALLLTKCVIEFPDASDVVHAFFKCLPEYFNSESFLKELKTEDEEKLFDEEEINDLMLHNYVWDSQFVKDNKLSSEVENALMFFVGTQLINDIF